MAGRIREPVNGLTHLIAAGAAIVGLLLLQLLTRGGWSQRLALAIYGLSLIGMFSASAVYHLAQVGPAALERLRKADHATIYLLIAGTYTPICLHYFDGFWRWGLLGIIWGMAAVGIVIKLFLIRVPRVLTAGIYLAMGWMAIGGLGEMLRTMPAGALAWLFAGGLFFTFGAVIYISRRPNFKPGAFGFHELWHIMVILGALSHYILVAAYVAAPAAGA
jgi:hemolysin III